MPNPVQQFSYHVSGAQIPQVLVPGDFGNVYNAIGVAQDGVDIMIQPAVHGIHHDGGGGMDGQPVEYLFLNAIATIRFRVVPYGGAYLNALRECALNTNIDGTLPYPGSLYGGSGSLVGLYLPVLGGGEVDGSWQFPTCLVVRPGDVRNWTKETTPELEFRAFVYLPPTTATIAGEQLYTRTSPP